MTAALRCYPPRSARVVLGRGESAEAKALRLAHQRYDRELKRRRGTDPSFDPGTPETWAKRRADQIQGLLLRGKLSRAEAEAAAAIAEALHVLTASLVPSRVLAERVDGGGFRGDLPFLVNTRLARLVERYRAWAKALEVRPVSVPCRNGSRERPCPEALAVTVHVAADNWTLRQVEAALAIPRNGYALAMLKAALGRF